MPVGSVGGVRAVQVGGKRALDDGSVGAERSVRVFHAKAESTGRPDPTERIAGDADAMTGVRARRDAAGRVLMSPSAAGCQASAPTASGRLHERPLSGRPLDAVLIRRNAEAAAGGGWVADKSPTVLLPRAGSDGPPGAERGAGERPVLGALLKQVWVG